MPTIAATRYAHALAEDIADALRAAPHAAGRVTVREDIDAGTWAVRVTIGRTWYELLMPAPGALYSLWRRGRWLGGLGLATDAAPVDVALAMLRRIEQTL
ncbi:hypothetical protein ACH5AJ_36430 [Streptomyces rochei]|uniref:hypothetical protein n=1 Tax=Streptomyces rochei TaxID=1928 RepID=UPI0037B95964